MIPVLIFGAVSIDVGRARGRVFSPVRPGSDQVMKLIRKEILPALSRGGSKLLALALHVCSLALHEDMR